MTPKKLQQMEFAAQFYGSQQNYQGEYCLGVVEVAGEESPIENVIEQL